jgi:hypothetical protein
MDANSGILPHRPHRSKAKRIKNFADVQRFPESRGVVTPPANKQSP